ncbi:MAG: recombination-associated protein RdgC [Neisseriaceae bacterium]|nr:recombination-associated protein RdgC [Neisseriaceae bacterium]
MWFKQIRLFQFNPDSLPENEILEEKLAQESFVPVAGLDWFSEGFTSPYDFSAQQIFAAEQSVLICLKKADKVLPAAVIRDLLAEKVAEIQENEHRQIGKKEKQELKEQLIDTLLPRAFVRSSRVFALLDKKNGLLLVNTANANKAENLLAKLREALGGLEAYLPQTQTSPAVLMTQWLKEGVCESSSFELDDEVELKGQGDVVSVVKMSKQDLTAEEVAQHLQSGKYVTQMGLVWRDRISFILTEDFALKRIRFLDILQDELAQTGEDAESLAIASQLLFSENLSLLIAELVHCLDGWLPRQ